MQSIHNELLEQGNARAPTCTSCHTSMATEVLATAPLEQRCRECHGNDPSERAAAARRQIEELTRLRRSLARGRLEITGIVDGPTRETLLARWHEADVSLRAVASGFHAFDERRVEDRISDARIQTTRLGDALGRARVR
jgi:hypothetical protein